MLLKKILVVSVFLTMFLGYSQEKKVSNPTTVVTAVDFNKVEPLRSKKLIPAVPKKGRVNPKSWSSSKVVPGKGYPKGPDPLVAKQKSVTNTKKGKAPSLVFQSGSTGADPSDPTGAVGPNHYVSALNSEFSIHDKSGNVLVGPSSLANIWPGETLGDPIVFYDNFADRFVITQFDGSNNPSSPEFVNNGFLIAVSQGPDPVNDGWYTFRFRTGNTFPDYPKFSVWSDGYYITTNKDQGTQDQNEVIYVLERDKLLVGDESAKMVGFPLPGSSINGFYSPASFNAIGSTPPPRGNTKIIYMQDDEWAGVSQDILKLWTINVNWISPDASTIQEAEELIVTPFDGVFDGGSFENLPQPGGGSGLDAQQAVIMHATNYRRFCNYNAVVLNFAVDIDTNADNVAGIRWYELRQSADDQPWAVHQEGTYTSPDGKSAWCGSMAMDIFGNIGMAYTTMGTTADGASQDSFASIRYTGRLASDPPGVMTVAEQTIVEGTGSNNTNRYGDYAHMTVDPVDDQTFWHTAEYFLSGSGAAQDVVGVFKIAGDVPNDVGVVSIDAPGDKTFTNAETVTVTIKNFGTATLTDIPVSYSIGGGTPVTELFAGPLSAGKTASFSFATTADLSAENMYAIDAETNLTADSFTENDCSSVEIKNLLATDVGATGLISPSSGPDIAIAPEPVTIIISNLGGTPQSNIPVFYILNNGTRVDEVFTGTIQPLETVNYTFASPVDATGAGTFEFQIGTVLAGDLDTSNDTSTISFERIFCRPQADCSFASDGITSFQLGNVTNADIRCGTGYEDFTSDFTIELSRLTQEFEITVQSGFADTNGAERFSFWIDFNDNSVFEDTEIILSDQIIPEENTDQSYTFSLGNDAPLGAHLLRIRAGDVNTNNGDLLSDPCGSMQYGTTHDYTVEIIDGPVGPNPNVETSVIIVSEPGNQFVITKVDPNGPEQERIYVFNIMGQIVASNLLKKDGNNTFTYELDMSYAKTGIYFVRLGDKRRKNVTGFTVR